MIVVDRARGTIGHRNFSDLPEYVPANDVFVVNATRVFRARLLGTRDSGAPAEIFLLKALDDNRFEAMVRPGGKLHPGRRVRIAEQLVVVVESITERRTRVVKLETPLPVWDAIEKYGHVPLPPYIQRTDRPADASDYQTIYARERGSVAAPTAGLHFTEGLQQKLLAGGAIMAEVVLHVGAGTFKPVEVDDPALHPMHEEWYEIGAETAETVHAARTSGHKVWAVGTTTLRALESNFLEHGQVAAGVAETRLFVRPPFQFGVVDHLITNLHLPRSSLLMLVAAFAGYELTMRAYHEAVADGYRFYSYGDAMLIL
jgi:S-adenosylmethionine:tRNA ribosyltransferase-isomerase